MNTAESHEPTIQELLNLEGKAALVTGGTGWLGSAMARAAAPAQSVFAVFMNDPLPS